VWGEVRITEPGADLKVTKLDVVPLQIEAAANQSLKKWPASAINGADETPLHNNNEDRRGCFIGAPLNSRMPTVTGWPPTDLARHQFWLL